MAEVVDRVAGEGARDRIRGHWGHGSGVPLVPMVHEMGPWSEVEGEHEMEEEGREKLEGDHGALPRDWENQLHVETHLGDSFLLLGCVCNIKNSFVLSFFLFVILFKAFSTQLKINEELHFENYFYIDTNNQAV